VREKVLEFQRKQAIKILDDDKAITDK